MRLYSVRRLVVEPTSENRFVTFSLFLLECLDLRWQRGELVALGKADPLARFRALDRRLGAFSLRLLSADRSLP